MSVWDDTLGAHGGLKSLDACGEKSAVDTIRTPLHMMIVNAVLRDDLHNSYVLGES